jgi:hypothetical protein
MNPTEKRGLRKQMSEVVGQEKATGSKLRIFGILRGTDGPDRHFQMAFSQLSTGICHGSWTSSRQTSNPLPASATLECRLARSPESRLQNKLVSQVSSSIILEHASASDPHDIHA